jgi:hypothetical protein
MARRSLRAYNQSRSTGLRIKTRNAHVEYTKVYEWIVAIMAGLIGGVANVVVFGGGFRRPRSIEGQEGETIYDPGFAGTMFVSGVAGFLAWSYSTNASFSDQLVNVKPTAGALVAGIAGSRALAVLVARQFGAGTAEQAGVATEELATTLANTRNELNTVRESEQRLREQNQILRETLGTDSDSTV